MIPPVEECLDFAAFLLGDTRKKKATPDKLLEGFRAAWLEMYDFLLADQIPYIESTALYTLGAGVTELAPLTAGISNLGELIRMEERPSGSSEQYTEVDPVYQLPQREQDAKLLQYHWAQDKWMFVGSTQNLQLRFVYQASGNPPYTGTTGIDGCKMYLGYRTASIVGPPLGFDRQLASDYHREACGPEKDGRGGHIFRLLQPMVRSKQKTPLQAPAYGEDGRSRARPRPPYYY